MYRYKILLVLLILNSTTPNVTAFDDISSLQPLVSAKGYILMDYHSGEIVLKSDSTKKLEPASITKVMTAFVAFRLIRRGKLKLNEIAKVSKNAKSMHGSRSFLEIGSNISVENLIKGIIIQSGNDAAVALAEHISGSEAKFVRLMNKQAKKLGMNNTHFRNVSGLSDPDHYSTAYDLAILAKALIDTFPDYYNYYSLTSFKHNNISQKNRNTLLFWDPTVDGIKTGYTSNAGYCLMASAKRNGRRLISVVLQDYSERARALSSKTLLEYGFKYYQSVKLKNKNIDSDFDELDDY